MGNDKTLEAFTDEDLALQAAGGAGECFEELVGRYGPRLFRFLRPKTQSDEEAEDLVQDAFRKAFQNIGSFDPRYRFSTWIYTIAQRLAVSLFRARRSSVEISEPEDTAVGPEERLIRKQESETIWALARNLRSGQFKALWLRYAEDLSVAEIARVMKTSSPHIRVLLHRGRVNLAAAFRRTDAEGVAESCRTLSFL
jgi:RNA polymerase sigma-70 factor (ECF subfamily)